jgi:hypothetical protein
MLDDNPPQGSLYSNTSIAIKRLSRILINIYTKTPDFLYIYHVYTKTPLVIIYLHLAISLPRHFRQPHFCSSSSPLLAQSTMSAPGPSLTAAATAKANVNENLTQSQGECLLSIGASSLLCLSFLNACVLFLFWTLRWVSKTQLEGEALRLRDCRDGQGERLRSSDSVSVSESSA